MEGQRCASIDCPAAPVKKAPGEKARIQIFESEMSLLTRLPTDVLSLHKYKEKLVFLSRYPSTKLHIMC